MRDLLAKQSNQTGHAQHSAQYHADPAGWKSIDRMQDVEPALHVIDDDEHAQHQEIELAKRRSKREATNP